MIARLGQAFLRALDALGVLAPMARCARSTSDPRRRSSSVVAPALTCTCPTEFHWCVRSRALGGLCVRDRATGRSRHVDTDAQARALAERSYPGCEFALGTLAGECRSIGGLPAGARDAVVLLILRPTHGSRCAVVGYVLSSVLGASCVPFQRDAWPHLWNHLPSDYRDRRVASN